MNNRPEGNDGHENMCDDRSQNDLRLTVYTQSQRTTGPKQRKISEIKTDRRSQETITVNR